MRGWVVGGLALGAGFLAYAISRPGPSSSAALPTTKRLRYAYLRPGQRPSTLAIGPAVVFFDDAPIRLYPGPNLDPVKRVIAFRNEFQAALAPRRARLPKGADRINADAYSQAQYWVPSWLVMGGPTPDLTHPASVPVDEFGRTFPGHYGAPAANLWDQTFGGLLKNPLFRTVAIAALVASGPAGMAAYGAYTLWQNRGRDLTIQNAALATARAYAVSQCSEACGVAFDFGVGVARGKSYDRAAEDALVKEMTPQQRAAYAQGKASLK